MLELYILGHFWRLPSVLCRKYPSMATVGRASLDEIYQQISTPNLRQIQSFHIAFSTTQALIIFVLVL